MLSRVRKKLALACVWVPEEVRLPRCISRNGRSWVAALLGSLAWQPYLAALLGSLPPPPHLNRPLKAQSQCRPPACLGVLTCPRLRSHSIPTCSCPSCHRSPSTYLTSGPLLTHSERSQAARRLTRPGQSQRQQQLQQGDSSCAGLGWEVSFIPAGRRGGNGDGRDGRQEKHGYWDILTSNLISSVLT